MFPRIKRAPVTAATAALALAVLYLGFTMNAAPRELIAAMLTGALSAAATLVFASAGDLRFRFHPRHVAQAGHLPAQILVGAYQLLHALFILVRAPRSAPSHLATAPFHLGDPSNPFDASRRALGVTLTTAAPNSIVLGFTRNPQQVVYHHIKPAKLPVMTRNLGARP